MRRILFASHGRFAAGMLDTLEMIVGQQPSVTALCAYTSECPDPKPELARAVGELPAGDELVIVTDVFGGSVNTEASQYRNRPNVYVVAGANLALAINLVVDQQTPTASLIERSLGEAREQMLRVQPDLVAAGDGGADEDF